MKFMKFLVVALIGAYLTQIKCDDDIFDENDCTDIARHDEPLLVFSTLGGGLTAVDPVTSEVRWSVEDDPAIKVPTHSDSTVSPYLPDPRDGSLYQLGDMGSLKKLPFTIPQLVASAPCRSSDGILYSGKKKDTWFLIDPKTGRREKVFGFGADSKDSIGWATTRAVYLGRTQYTVLMYDSQNKDKNVKPWNVTFFDYTSHSMAPEVSEEYEFLHFSGSSSGLTVTLGRETGAFMWQKDLSSPVVAVFLLGPDGLLSVPFTTVSDEALKNIIEYARDGQHNNMKYFQSLYVGEHHHGAYALPTLVDENTKTLSSEPLKLLDGPGNVNPNLVYLNSIMEKSQNKNKNVVVYGYHEMPKMKDKLELGISGSKASPNGIEDVPIDKGQENGNYNGLAITNKDNENEMFNLNLNRKENNGNIIPPPKEPTTPKQGFFAKLGIQSPEEYISNVYRKSQAWLDHQESKILKLLLIILFGLIIAMFWYMKFVLVSEIRQQKDLVDLGNGINQVGKISFNASEVLGKGCEGTFVFKGQFEKRDVAVKRLLPGCFTLADREVALLRESDAHENIVRYFCTEQDRQFCYIALELCSATVQDYTEGNVSPDIKRSISMIELLQQATNGLMHLHSLNIVHRDIKPQNVLLSFPDAHRKIRVMISDFGLCKKLNFGKASFSRRSGITGTEGWIAPEILKGQRTTTAVDIFSLGCVYYYVISSGKHPFGEPVKRQSNILSHEYDMKVFANPNNLDNEFVLAEELIKDMISEIPIRRPTAKSTLRHPFFWNAEKVLNFLQDVSDRVEKIDFQSDPLKTLEKNSKYITRDDWNLHLDEMITSDLRKYRAYQGNSVRDLLRALRNKKHHFHELTSDTQTRLGTIPGMFVKYWTSRFPRLLSHSYHALQSCSEEPIFSVYYPKSYAFSKPNYFYEDTEDFKPFDTGPKLLKCTNSPKRQYNNPEYRYKPMNYPNFVMTRKSGPKSQNGGAMNSADGNYMRTNKKGTYNFQRNWLNPSNESRFDNENPILRDNGEAVKDENVVDYGDENAGEKRRNSEKIDAEPKVADLDSEFRRSSMIEEKFAWNMDFERKEEHLKLSDNEKKTEKMERTKVDKTDQPKYEKHSAKQKKIKQAEPHSSGSSSREFEVDEDGFTKVKYKAHHVNAKKHKSGEHQNEHVKWIVPGRENK